MSDIGIITGAAGGLAASRGTLRPRRVGPRAGRRRGLRQGGRGGSRQGVGPQGCRRQDRHHQGGRPAADRRGDPASSAASSSSSASSRACCRRLARSRLLIFTEWDRVLNINVRANVILIKHFVAGDAAAGGGSIVTVSSWYGRSGHGLFSAYCASKAALISLTHSAAAELAAGQYPGQFRRAGKRRDFDAFQGAARGGREASVITSRR